MSRSALLFDTGLSRSALVFDTVLSRSALVFDTGLSRSALAFDTGLTRPALVFDTGLLRSALSAAVPVLLLINLCCLPVLQERLVSAPAVYFVCQSCMNTSPSPSGVLCLPVLHEH